MSKYKVNVKTRLAIDITEDYTVYATDEETAKNKAINQLMGDISFTYGYDNPEYINYPVAAVELTPENFYFSVTVFYNDGTEVPFIVHTQAMNVSEAKEKVNKYLYEKYPTRYSETVVLCDDIQFVTK